MLFDAGAILALVCAAGLHIRRREPRSKNDDVLCIAFAAGCSLMLFSLLSVAWFHLP